MSINLNQLKENIQSILETANTTTASVPLSNGLTDSINTIYKVNPYRIPFHATRHPFVTVYIDQKVIEESAIAATQINAKRLARVEVKVVGVVFDSTFNNFDTDKGDEQCETLMENIEEILRNNPTLSGIATWSFATDVVYHTTKLDEESIVRAGMLSLRASIFY